jgi:hypothetical protein
MIMGDDIGWFNIGVYNQGIMAGRTPNLDQLAAQGMRFTDYYAEASCTAGRANFITGELPIRTGLTTVGQAGSPLGMPDEAPTIATVLKSMGYATGQFGKNHLGDRNQFPPTMHGFDEFFGYLYHLDAMEDPCHRNYPPALKDTVGPRHMIHSFATDVDDATVEPRWGKIGKQRIEDAARCRLARWRTASYPAWTGSRHLWPPLATRTSLRNSRKASNSVTAPTGSTSTAAIRRTLSLARAPRTVTRSTISGRAVSKANGDLVGQPVLALSWTTKSSAMPWPFSTRREATTSHSSFGSILRACTCCRDAH